MHVRQNQKNGDLRITLDTSKSELNFNVSYIQIKADTECLRSTFNKWGKRVDSPIVLLGRKKFRVVLEQV